MFFQFIGLSLFVHLFVIISAKVVNYFRGHTHKHKSAYQTYNKNGGVVAHDGTNRLISFFILFATLVYMAALSSVAVVTAVTMGADEPQVIWYKHAFATAFEFLLFDGIQPITWILGALVFGVWQMYQKRNKVEWSNPYLHSCNALCFHHNANHQGMVTLRV